MLIVDLFDRWTDSSLLHRLIPGWSATLLFEYSWDKIWSVYQKVYPTGHLDWSIWRKTDRSKWSHTGYGHFLLMGGKAGHRVVLIVIVMLTLLYIFICTLKESVQMWICIWTLKNFLNMFFEDVVQNCLQLIAYHAGWWRLTSSNLNRIVNRPCYLCRFTRPEWIFLNINRG